MSAKSKEPKSSQDEQKNDPALHSDESPPKKDSHEEQYERLKETTEKLWDSTRHAFSTATFKANQYKQLVQKKIDLSAIHKKISSAHSELGKLIDDLHESGKKSIMAHQAVKVLLKRLEELKSEAVTLEKEIADIRAEQPDNDDESPE